jgi:DNA mismatch endonuclease (patch repair protein)
VSAQAEQDRAAGGRHRRKVDLGDGRFATASVTLRLYPKTRRIRAALRWSQDGKSPERYLGEVSSATRAENLSEAWNRAWEKGLLTAETLPAGSKASSVNTRAVMRANKAKDTRLELAVRSLLHGRGLRYRVCAKPLRDFNRTADIVFTRARVAVFLDGCFWHGCPEHFRPAKQNALWWAEKIQRNRDRDAETTRVLRESGWMVLRFWGHEDPAMIADAVTGEVHEPSVPASRAS